MTAPNPQPLIKSSQELKDRGDIWIVADKDRNPEVILLVKFSPHKFKIPFLKNN